MPEKTGTFLVTQVDAEEAVLSDVADRQVHTLESHPDLTVEEVLEATIATEPPLDVLWRIEEIHERREIEVTVSEERPTKASREIAADLESGDLHTRERMDYGEIHVLRVPAEEMEAAVEDVATDRETVARAARLDSRRVEIRSRGEVLAVRYLP